MKLLKCENCQSYGLSTPCGCGGLRIPPKPPKFSPEDKYGKYRRMWKHDLENHDE